MTLHSKPNRSFRIELGRRHLDANAYQRQLPIKIIEIYNTRVTDVVFEVEYLCNGWVKKDGVNANLL